MRWLFSNLNMISSESINRWIIIIITILTTIWTWFQLNVMNKSIQMNRLIAELLFTLFLEMITIIIIIDMMDI